MIIRLLDCVLGGVTGQDGGSDGAVITADHINLEPIKLEQLKKVPRQGGAVRKQLELSSRVDEDGSQVITVAGELDIATAEQAYSYISEVIDGLQTPVSVDLSGLSFCDASGLGVLARVARHAREAGRQLRLTSARPSLLKIMRITGLDNAFPELRPSAPAYSALTDLEKLFTLGAP